MNEYCYHGVKGRWDDGYIKLMCAVIRQAVLHAQGLELDDNGKPTKLKEGTLKATAVEYLLSEDFEDECMYLNLPPDFVDKVREKITRGTYQIPVFTVEQVREEYNPKKITQKELALKYGVTQQRISQITPRRKRVTTQDAEKMREKYSYHGMQLKDIAKEYGYSLTVICQAINGTYPHLAGAGK